MRLVLKTSMHDSDEGTRWFLTSFPHAFERWPETFEIGVCHFWKHLKDLTGILYSIFLTHHPHCIEITSEIIIMLMILIIIANMCRDLFKPEAKCFCMIAYLIFITILLHNYSCNQSCEIIVVINPVIIALVYWVYLCVRQNTRVLYSSMHHNGVLVTDRPHIWQWSHRIIMKEKAGAHYTVEFPANISQL